MQKSRRNLGRELVLLAAPLLVIGGMAFWQSKRLQKQRVAESGPYRTEITRVETLEVSPVEAWHGFDRKIRIHFGVRGRPPQQPGLKLKQWFWLDTQREVVLKGWRGSQKGLATVSTHIMEGGVEELVGPLVKISSFGSPQEPTLCLLMNTSSFPQNEVKVEGAFAIEQPAQVTGATTPLPKGIRGSRSGGYQAIIRPVEFSLVVRRAGELIAPTVEKKPIPVNMIGSRLCSPHMQQRYEWMMNGGWGDTIAALQMPEGSESDHQHHKTQFFKVAMYDQKNRPVKEWSPKDWRAGSYNTWEKKGWITQTVDVRWRGVPASRGPLWVKGFVSADENWPSPFSIQVRRKEDYQRPPHLQLREVRFVPPNKVQVTLRYLGSKTLEVFNSTYNSPYDIRDQVGHAFTFPPGKNEDRLLSHWSEHLELANGKEDWESVKATSAAKDVGNEFLVTYSINTLKALKPNDSATFKADIGLEEEGFIPVQCRITRAH